MVSGVIMMTTGELLLWENAVNMPGWCITSPHSYNATGFIAPDDVLDFEIMFAL